MPPGGTSSAPSPAPPSRHAGRLRDAILSRSSITLIDHLTGFMNRELRRRRQVLLDRKKKLPADLDALLRSQNLVTPRNADNSRHELILVTGGDQIRLSLDVRIVGHHRSPGFAHPVKRWFSFRSPPTG